MLLVHLLFDKKADMASTVIVFCAICMQLSLSAWLIEFLLLSGKFPHAENCIEET